MKMISLIRMDERELPQKKTKVIQHSLLHYSAHSLQCRSTGNRKIATNIFRIPADIQLDLRPIPEREG